MNDNEGFLWLVLVGLWVGTGYAVHNEYFAVGAMAAVAAVVLAVFLVGFWMANHVIDNVRLR